MYEKQKAMYITNKIIKYYLNIYLMKKHRANEQGIFGYESKKRTQQT